MECTEIRYQRKRMRWIVCLLLPVFLLLIYLGILSLLSSPDLGMLIFLIPLSITGVILFFMIRALIYNKPALLLSKESIIIGRGVETTTILWKDVVDWTLGFNDLVTEARPGSNGQLIEGYAIFITTTTGREVVNLEWVDVDFEELDELLRYYQPSKQ